MIVCQWEVRLRAVVAGGCGEVRAGNGIGPSHYILSLGNNDPLWCGTKWSTIRFSGTRNIIAIDLANR